MSVNHPEGSRDELFARYRQMKKEDGVIHRCPVCGDMGAKAMMEPHHPCGRDGTNVLLYVWVCIPCHRWVHDNPKEATRIGMLWKGRNTKACSDEEWEKLKQLWPQ